VRRPAQLAAPAWAAARTQAARQRIIEYGPSIEVLIRKLEAGAFE
jgi:hypothetical protein